MSFIDLFGPMIISLVGFCLFAVGVLFVMFLLIKKEVTLKYSLIVVVVIVVGLFMAIGLNPLVLKAEIPPNLKTYGPGDGPTIPLVNAIKFLLKSGKIEKVSNISVDPNSVPPPRTNTQPEHYKIDLEAKEVISSLADGTFYNFWTFNGTVPGPFLRVKVGDTVELSLKNNLGSINMHNIDFHAVTGPGGGATATNVDPGQTKTFTFKALNPGIYVYHCAHGNPPAHMTHGMYGLILVEPLEGLPKVDKEFYVMQGEFYTTNKMGSQGMQVFDAQKMLDGKPEYVVFNGRVGGAVGNMVVNKGERVRIYVGNGGVNLISSFHLIGEIFDTVYPEGSIGNSASPFKNIQTTAVPAGGATIVEFTADVPGKYVLVDHALARTDRGAWGTIEVRGESAPQIFSGQIEQHSHGH